MAKKKKKAAKRTTTRKKATRATAKKKTTRKKAAPRAKATAPKIKGSADARTKSQIFNTIAEATDMSRKEVTTILGALESMVVADLKKGTDVKFMGMKMSVKKKPAKKARKGINPFTKEPMMFKAKPASKAVKVRALKALNDQI
jgi:nucleoid DNA-binding protein